MTDKNTKKAENASDGWNGGNGSNDGVTLGQDAPTNYELRKSTPGILDGGDLKKNKDE